MPNTMPDMVSRPAVVKKSLLGCEWSRKVQKLKTTKFQNQAVPKPGGAARGGVQANHVLTQGVQGRTGASRDKSLGGVQGAGGENFKNIF